MTSAYETFTDRAFIKLLRMTPEVIGVMGLSELPEFSDLGGDLNDYSLKGLEDRQTALREIYQQHIAYTYEELTSAEKLSYRVFDYFLCYMPFDPWTGVAGEEFSAYAYPVCHVGGAPAETFNLLINFHSIQSIRDADNYLKRLAKLAPMFTDLENVFRYRHEEKLNPPQSSLKIVIREISILLEQGIEQTGLLTTFKQKLSRAKGVSLKQASYYCAKAHTILEAFYQNNLPSLLSCLQELSEGADKVIGVSRFDRGGAYYQYCLTRQTSTQFTADEVYALGEVEVARLKSELIKDVRAVGHNGDEFKTTMAKILHENHTQVGSEEATRSDILAHVQRLVRDTKKSMRPYFNLYPNAECEVKATPKYLEMQRTSCYYPPSAVGSYSGILELNLKYELGKPHWSRNNLVYHEVYPGHHLQITLAQENKRLSLFRRTFVNAGFLEGWAKYAERLPYETGVDNDLRYELQRKAVELISASNLMLDVGIHTRNWSRQEAVAFSMDQALIDEATAEYLVDRITVSPGQTTAYAVGLAAFRKHRENACAQLGDAFTLAGFHDILLGEGALPLDVLDEYMSTVLLQKK